MLSTKELYTKLKEAGIQIVDGRRSEIRGGESSPTLVLMAKKRLAELLEYQRWLEIVRPAGIIEYRTGTGVVLVRIHDRRCAPPPLIAVQWRESSREGPGRWRPIEDGMWTKGNPSKWIGCDWGEG